MPFNTQRALREEIRRGEIRKRAKRLKKLAVNNADPQEKSESSPNKNNMAVRIDQSAFAPGCDKHRSKNAIRFTKKGHALKAVAVTGLPGMDVKPENDSGKK